MIQSGGGNVLIIGKERVKVLFKMEEFKIVDSNNMTILSNIS